MRITNKKTIYLTRQELDEAILIYIRDNHGRMDVAGYIQSSPCEIELLENQTLKISIEREVEDIMSSANHPIKGKVLWPQNE